MIVRVSLALLLLLNVGYGVWQLFPKGETTRDSTLAMHRKMETHEPSILLLDEGIDRGLAVTYGVMDRPPPPSFLEVCTKIGAFPDQETAQIAYARLVAVSIRSVLESAEIGTEENDYQIFIPPESNRVLANILVKTLARQNIVGTVLTAPGELENAVSLGVFSDPVQAEARLKEYAAQGYDVRMQEVPRFQTVYWIKLTKSDNELVGEGLWQSLHARFPFIERVGELCDASIALPQ